MVNAVGTATPPVTGPAAGAPAASFSGGDFQTFLKMLTTQIKNQDPLNPMEGSDFAVQLATFSGVEQQVRTNALLSELGGAMRGDGLEAYAGWIGREVRSTAPAAFGDAPVTLDVAPDPAADRVVLIALDASGRVATREDIGQGAGEVDWFGRDAAGAKLPDGLYRFRLENWKGEQKLSETAVPSFARVEQARLSPSGVMLVLAGGPEVAVDDVTALRDAPAPPS